VRSDGAIDGALAARSRRVQRDGRTSSYLLYDEADGQRGVVITQADVRAIQLAKAALYAGARLLMQHMGVTKVDRIRLAGAFGSQIDVRYAMILGMIPDCDLAQVSSAGNAAGTGARLALLSQGARTEIEQRSRSIEKIETAVEKNFQQYFVEAMAIPHSRHPFTELARVVALPARSVAADDPAGGRRRTRSRK
jgi:uncharacterized 2Fe-2S/4Fe-4S cluster protein (DUF4445 family)